MRVLFILDPLVNLDLEWDTSVALMKELSKRGHETLTADVPDLLKGSIDLNSFDLILIRKEPPVNEDYIRMTHLTEAVAHQVVISNHPRGIRETNEKACILNFPDIIPESLVSAESDELLEFQRSLKTDVVIKPLNDKGGKGIFILPFEENRTRRTFPEIDIATQQGRIPVMAQRYLTNRVDKRILILDGKILTAFEKHAPLNDFRTNLSVGGTYHPTELTKREIEITVRIRPYLERHGLSLVGIDVMDEKLIEVNVTCPAGICEAKALHPQLELVEAWADSLEAQVHPVLMRKALQRHLEYNRATAKPVSSPL